MMVCCAQSTMVSRTAAVVTDAILPFSTSKFCLSGHPRSSSSNTTVSCVDNKIVKFPLITKPYKLMAYNSTKLIVGGIEACGLEFHIQNSGACTYCPSQVGSSCPPGKETVLLPGTGMVGCLSRLKSIRTYILA